MKQNPHLRLRRIGNRNIIVDARDNINLVDVFSLNATAASLWRYMEEGVRSVEGLALRLCHDYDVEMNVALRDVKRQLDEWIAAGLVEPTA